ncbi:MAG: HAD family hydrolase [Lactobacillales bacterium]|nr:HAD family hydrolase [Lactobacillales bacterium]
MDRIFLFDLGDVLVEFLDDYDLYNKLNCKISYDEFLPYWWGDDLVIKAHMGLAIDDEHVEALLKFCKSDLSISEFYEMYNNLDKSLYNDTVQIINELKNKGYKVGLLSNLRLMDYKRYEEQIKKIDFDYVFLSYEMKCIKPSKDIYLQVINKLNCEANNIIFFDDNEKNVEGAKAVGINAYQVTGKNIKEVFNKII